jgi:hypothetical protein
MSPLTLIDQATRPHSRATLERRVWVRHPCEEGCGRAVEIETQLGWWGRVREVSVGGVGLTLSHAFRPGTALLLELRTTVRGQVLPIRAEVVHATAVTDGRWIVGCRWLSPLTDDELRLVLGSSR